MLDSIRQIFQRSTSLVNNHSLGVAAAFSAKVSGAGLGFLFSLMLARLLGSTGTGIYFLALTIVSIGATIARLGLDNSVLRFASVAHNNNDLRSMAALYRQSMGLAMTAGVLISLLFWLIAPYLPLGGEQSNELQFVLPVMLIALVPTALILLQGEFFKATGAPGMATFIQAVILPIFLIMGTAALFLLGEASVRDIALLYAVAATASVLFASIVWNRRKPELWKQQGHFDILLLLRTSLPLLWVASMGLVMGWTDILVLGFWVDSSTVGIYGIATRTAALTAFILVAINSVTAPQFATLYAQGNHKAMERLAQRSAGWMLLAASPIILILLLFPEWILKLFGTDFVEGASLLRILTLGQLVNVAVGSVGYLLIMTGHERLMRNITILSALLNLVGNLVLIPRFGAMGAAVSTVFSLAFLNIVAFWGVRLRLHINVLGYLFGEKPGVKE